MSEYVKMNKAGSWEEGVSKVEERDKLHGLKSIPGLPHSLGLPEDGLY